MDLLGDWFSISRCSVVQARIAAAEVQAAAARESAEARASELRRLQQKHEVKLMVAR